MHDLQGLPLDGEYVTCPECGRVQRPGRQRLNWTEHWGLGPWSLLLLPGALAMCNIVLSLLLFPISPVICGTVICMAIGYVGCALSWVSARGSRNDLRRPWVITLGVVNTLIALAVITTLIIVRTSAKNQGFGFF